MKKLLLQMALVLLFGVFVFQPEKAYASTVTGNVEIQNVNTVSGVFDVKITNVDSSDGIQEVYVPVWSAGDQSDIVWYRAEEQVGGTYVVHVDVANHDCNFANYYVHTYVKSTYGDMLFVNETTVDLNTPGAIADISVTDGYSKISLDVWHAPGTLGESLKGVSFAVWSSENGQDDLRWYSGQLVRDRYIAETSFEKHSGDGNYNVHVYAQYVNGENKFVAADVVDVISAKSDEIKITNLNNVTGTFDVVVSNVTAKNGVKEVLVPIWSAGNQSDIVWYTAERQSDSTYKVHVDVANHNCNFANYQVHVYVRNGWGEFVNVGATSANLNTPGATTTVSMNEDWSALSVDAWHVPGTLGVSLKGVSFAVWSEENGQDDLRWYEGQLSGDRYLVDASLRNHSGDGIYHVHAYAQYANGENRFVTSNAMNVVSAKADEIKIANLNNVAGTFDVVLSNVMAQNGVKEVRIPIWSMGNQSDIIWYTAERQSDGTYKVHVDVASHNCNFANYQVHVYVLNGFDEFVNIGVINADVNTPGATTTVSMNECYSEISVDAWRVPGTNGNSLSSVYFAIWSANDGQDDLVWYRGNASNDHFVVSLDMDKHSDVGLYHVHVYADRPNGRVFVQNITFDRPLTKIMGTSNVTLSQLVKFYNLNEIYPAFYANSDAPTIEAFCQIYLEECAIEGVKVEVAFAQAMLETGFMRYKGDVEISQYNFAGIGATGGGNPGNSFSSVREGIRAQIQHLKAYATSDSLNQPCVDPRFDLVRREAAPYLEWLGIQENPYGTGWATGKDYGYRIRDRYVYRIYEM